MKLIKSFKVAISKSTRALGYEIRRHSGEPAPRYPENDPDYADTIRAVREFTMTSTEKIAALIDATRYVVRAKIPGAVVECGVWRGGSMMAAASTLLAAGDIRDLYLFDTFAGMTEPTREDVDYMGVPAEAQYLKLMADDHNEWCYASLEDVRRNLISTGYPPERCHFIKGDVLKTLPHEALGAVAILRLDTDWYESTLQELRVLYPLLSQKGVLILDDYGSWKGCKKAVDEYFGINGPFLSAIGQVGRIGVKTV